MRKVILGTILAGFTFASVANAAEMVRYERDVYSDDDSGYSQSNRGDYNREGTRTSSRDTRFDSQYRSKHPINWAAKDHD
jgi:hypothetical protein